MSRSKTRFCDCCGKKIPYDENKTHMEYDGHVAHCLPYTAEDEGNKEFNRFSQKGDRIFGLVDINMHRERREETVTLTNRTNGRCMDICTQCKIKFLEHTIQYLKRYGN